MMGGFYIVELQDKHSQDTNFNLNYDVHGKFMYSTYYEILDNTYNRYRAFLKDYAKDIADEEAFDFKFSLEPDNELKYEYYLKLDQDFDREHLPSKVLAHFHAYEDEPSLDGMMTRLKKVQKPPLRGIWTCATTQAESFPQLTKPKRAWQNRGGTPSVSIGLWRRL